MNVVVTTESRFYKDSSGRWSCLDGTYGYAFWRRYLDAFDRVIVVARCSKQIVRQGIAVEGKGVELLPLEDAHGAVGAVLRWSTWQHHLGPLATSPSAFILRLPGQIGIAFGQVLKRHGRPYGVEAVGDPAAVFGPGGYRHPLRPGLRFFFQRTMRQLCQGAGAAAYVTAEHLQSQYPPNASAFTTNYSSLELLPSEYATEARNYLRRPYPLHLINVGTMSQHYKGQHVLIAAVARCMRAGRRVQLALIGDGRLRSELERTVRRERLSDCVRFLGQLPSGAAIRQALDQADAFVLSSLTEGLPRVLLEAQARGLPCLATDVGGVPELLDERELVPPRKPTELAVALMRLLDDPHRLSRLSEENLQRSRRFASPILGERRTSFYQKVRELATTGASTRVARAA